MKPKLSQYPLKINPKTRQKNNAKQKTLWRGGGGVKKQNFHLRWRFGGGPNTCKRVAKACHTTPSQASQASGEARRDREATQKAKAKAKDMHLVTPTRASAVADNFNSFLNYVKPHSFYDLL